jgi:hypothetical protein
VTAADLDVIGLSSAKAHIACVANDRSVRQAEELKDAFGVGVSFSCSFSDSSGQAKLYELDLFELVLAIMASGVLAVAARFATEARRIGSVKTSADLSRRVSRRRDNSSPGTSACGSGQAAFVVRVKKVVLEFWKLVSPKSELRFTMNGGSVSV